MPKSMSLIRTAKGLQSQYNQAMLPEGALLEAENVEIDREGTVSKSRGYARYGQVLVGNASALLEYADALIVHDGTALKYDSDGVGTWSNYSGTYSQPDSATKMRGIEANRNFYFTTSAGVYALDTIDGTPRLAGMPLGLDLEITKSGIGGGWFLPDSQVAYRVVWGRVDANATLHMSAPSMRITDYNSKVAVTCTYAGGTVTVTQTAHGYLTNDIIEVYVASDPLYEVTTHTITKTGADTYTYAVSGAPASPGTLTVGKKLDMTINAPIPSGIQAGDFCEVYRTNTGSSPDDDTDPGDDLYKVYRIGVVAADVTNGYISWTDTYDNDWLGEPLYTNAAEETIYQQASRPPFALDIAQFKGYAWYANTSKPQFFELQLLTVTGITDDTDTISFTLGATTLTYTWSTARDVANRKFKRWTTAATMSLNIRYTARDLIQTINRDTGNSIIYAYYVSGIQDTAGKIVIEARSPNTAAFSITMNAGTPAGVWSPELPAAGTAISSENDASPNRLYHSKYEQPEAVPDLNFVDIGSRTNEVRRILALRDSLIVMTREGVWRVSGEDEHSFTYKQLDPSIHIRAPECAVVLNNSVYCLSTQGVVKITESGTAIVSRDIEDKINAVAQETTYETLCFAVGYESARKYMLFVPEHGESTCTLAYVYNYLTNAWTTRRKALCAGRVMLDADMLYVAHASDTYILRERKVFAGSTIGNYADEILTVPITYAGTTTDALGATVSEIVVDMTGETEDPDEGWLVTQGALTGHVATATNTAGDDWTLVLDSEVDGIAAGDCTLTIGIPSRVRWAPEAGQNPTSLKQFSQVQVYMESTPDVVISDPWIYQLGVTTDLETTESWLSDFRLTTLVGGQPLRFYVPRAYQRARMLNLIFQHTRPFQYFDIVCVGHTIRMTGDRTVKTNA